jgi:hypothetical protein
MVRDVSGFHNQQSWYTPFAGPGFMEFSKIVRGLFVDGQILIEI